MRGHEQAALALSRKILGPEHPDTMAGMHVLGHCLERSGASHDALALREEEAALRQKVHGRDHSATIRSLIGLAGSYYNAGRIDEALTMRSDALLRSRKLLGSEHPHTVLAAIESATLYVSAGRREKALHLLAELASRNLQTTVELLNVATLQVWLDLASDHATMCRRMLDRGIASDDPSAAWRAAKACCLRPLHDSQLIGKAVSLARRAVEAGRRELDLPRYQLGLGLAEFRHGNLAEANDALTAAERNAAKLKLLRERAHVECTSRLYRAMVLFRQGRQDDARKLFHSTMARFKPPPEDGQPLREVATRDDLILWLAWRETGTLHRNQGPRISKSKTKPKHRTGRR